MWNYWKFRFVIKCSGNLTNSTMIRGFTTCIREDVCYFEEEGSPSVISVDSIDISYQVSPPILYSLWITRLQE